jgi:hypothetical protein
MGHRRHVPEVQVPHDRMRGERLRDERLRTPAVAASRAAELEERRARERPRTLHHRGMGEFMIAGRRVRLPSKMR